MTQHGVSNLEVLHFTPNLLHDSGELLAQHHGVVLAGFQIDPRPLSHAVNDVLDVESAGLHPHQHLVGLQAGSGHVLQYGEVLGDGGPAGRSLREDDGPHDE